MKNEAIICPTCGDNCGIIIPADHTDPSYYEGIGENFVGKDGFWYCSSDCMIVGEEFEQ